MNKKDFLSFLRRLLIRTGGWYPIIVLVIAQLGTSSSGLLLAALLSKINAELNNDQTIGIVAISGLSLLIRNIILLIVIYFVNRQMIRRLANWTKGKPLDSNSAEEGLAWRQCATFAGRYIILALASLFLFVLPPALLYMRFSFNASIMQLIYVSFSSATAGLGLAVLENLIVDYLMGPAREALLPKQFEKQFGNMRGFPLLTKLLVVITALILVGILLVAPFGYHQTEIALNGGVDPHQILKTLQLQLITAGIGALFLGFVLAYFMTRSISTPIHYLINGFSIVEGGDLTHRLQHIPTDEVGELTIYFNHTIERLESLQIDMEKRVAERTTELTRRTTQLQAAAQVARETASSQDLKSLLTKTVGLISQMFGFYHAGIFLLDDSSEYVVLQTTSSDGGKRMLARGHKFSVGRQSIIGAAAYENRSRLASNVGADAAYIKNPDLPETRSEVALPLSVGRKVIGVLDIQSTEVEAFSTGDVQILQTIADQIALAIQNARLLSESQEALNQLRYIATENVLRSWSERIRQQKPGYRYTQLGLVPYSTQPARTGMLPTLESVETGRLDIQITLRGQKIGIITLNRKGKTQWRDTDRALALEVANQVGLALENTRLLEDAQQRVAQEQSLSELTARLGRSLDPDTLLQTIVRELHQLPNVSEVSVFITPPDTQASDGSS